MFEDSLLESSGRLKPNRDWATLASMRRAVDSRTRRPFPQLCETGPRRDGVIAISNIPNEHGYHALVFGRHRCPLRARLAKKSDAEAGVVLFTNIVPLRPLRGISNVGAFLSRL